MVGLLFRLAVIALIGYVVWRVMIPRYAVRIVIGNQGIKYHKGLSKANEEDVLAYFEKHRSFDGDVTILAARHADGDLRLVFRGQVDPHTQQQIREFLITVI